MRMARQARKKSESGIYHIMLRGIKRQQIFEDEEDRQKFLDTLENYKDLWGQGDGSVVSSPIPFRDIGT